MQDHGEHRQRRAEVSKRSGFPIRKVLGSATGTVAPFQLKALEALEYCTISTECSVTHNNPLFLMRVKIVLIRKKNYRPSRTSKIPKLMNTWSKCYSSACRVKRPSFQKLTLFPIQFTGHLEALKMSVQYH